jgi:hypothetical protein
METPVHLDHWSSSVNAPWKGGTGFFSATPSNASKFQLSVLQLPLIYCQVLVLMYTAYTKEWCGFNSVHY